MLAACAIHYDLHLPSVVRYLSGEYTAEFRSASKIKELLESYNCPKEIVDDMYRIFKVGCPNKLIGEGTRENFVDYWKYNNHSSIHNNVQKVMKVMNKEDRHSFLIPFPRILAWFAPNVMLTPQGLVIKPPKKDRLVWDGSFMIFYKSVCVNSMFNLKDEPTLAYGSAWQRHINRIWNLRISYPQEEIYLFDDDVKGAFRQVKYNPDVSSVFSFIISLYFFLPTGGTFGAVPSPSNFEPIARARTYLANLLSRKKALVKKHWDIIKLMKFSRKSPTSTTYVQAVADEINIGVLDEQGNSRTVYSMFVDDSLYAEVHKHMLVAIAASIEALFLLLGFPQDHLRQNNLSLDKFYESTCSYKRVQLGKEINTRTMMVAISSDRKLKIKKEMTHWHAGRKSFSILDSVKLLGIVENWAEISPWVRFLLSSLRLAVTAALHASRVLVCKRKEILIMASEVAKEPYMDIKDLRQKFLDRKIARDVYHSHVKVFITVKMREELDFLIQVLEDDSKFPLSSPIAHLAQRIPDCQTFGDACLDAAGGFSEDLKFWWHLQFPLCIRKLTLRHFQILVKEKRGHELITINVLEFVTEIINFAAALTFHGLNPEWAGHPYPTLLNWTDNRTARAWLRKAALKSDMARRLQKILCSMMINSPLGLSGDYIQGVDNVIADSISRVYSNTNEIPSYTSLLQKLPQLRTYQRFQPSPDFLSLIYSALLLEPNRELLLPSKLGHFIPGSNII